MVNLLGVRVFGELEFWFSSVKVLALIGLILMGLIIDAGGNPSHDWIEFRYWRPPYGPMGNYLQEIVGDGALSRFLGFWAVMVNARMCISSHFHPIDSLSDLQSSLM